MQAGIFVKRFLFFFLSVSLQPFEKPAKSGAGSVFWDPITRHCEIIRAWLNLLSSQTKRSYNHSWRDKKLNPVRNNNGALLALFPDLHKKGSGPSCCIWWNYIESEWLNSQNKVHLLGIPQRNTNRSKDKPHAFIRVWDSDAGYNPRMLHLFHRRHGKLPDCSGGIITAGANPSVLR